MHARPAGETIVCATKRLGWRVLRLQAVSSARTWYRWDLDICQRHQKSAKSESISVRDIFAHPGTSRPQSDVKATSAGPWQALDQTIPTFQALRGAETRSSQRTVRVVTVGSPQQMDEMIGKVAFACSTRGAFWRAFVPLTTSQLELVSLTSLHAVG